MASECKHENKYIQCLLIHEWYVRDNDLWYRNDIYETVSLDTCTCIMLSLDTCILCTRLCPLVQEWYVHKFVSWYMNSMPALVFLLYMNGMYKTVSLATWMACRLWCLLIYEWYVRDGISWYMNGTCPTLSFETSMACAYWCLLTGFFIQLPDSRFIAWNL